MWYAYRAYKIGDDVEFSVKANASGRSTRTVRLSINTKAVNYIGVAKSSIRKSTATMKITPGSYYYKVFFPHCGYKLHVYTTILVWDQFL